MGGGGVKAALLAFRLENGTYSQGVEGKGEMGLVLESFQKLSKTLDQVCFCLYVCGYL